MSLFARKKKGNHGFSLIELMVVIAVIAVLAGLAVPSFFAWRPNYQLRRAAKDLYSNFQVVKMEAIKTGQPATITFNQGTNTYQLTIAGVPRPAVNLADYGNDIQYGMGMATTPATGEAGTAGQPITFTGAQTIFDSRGLVDTAQRGYAYITNGTACFAVGITTVAGAVAIHRNSGVSPGDKWD